MAASLASGCATVRLGDRAGDALPAQSGPARGGLLGLSISPEASIERLAKTIDGLQWELVREGTIGIKVPDIWGQDRMTKTRSEYEQQLAGQQKDGFKSVTSAVIRRYEAVTSQLEMDAVVPTLTPSASKNDTTTALAAATAKAAPLTPAPARDATDKEPIGVESTVLLDERSHFLNHLNQLRRINAGDELTDRPGYGLYLIRMPITLAPGRGTNRGRGAIVTVEARPYLSRSLLPDTVRRVVLAGTKEQLRPIVLACLRGTPPASGGGAVPVLSAAEVEDLFGREALKSVCRTAKSVLGADIEREPHRAEVRVAEWLDRELTTLYPLATAAGPQAVARGQAGEPDVTAAALADLVAGRRFRELARLRELTPADPRIVRAGVDELKIDGPAVEAEASVRVARMMTFALRVQAAAVDRMIRDDIYKYAQDRERNRLSPELIDRLGEMTFAGLDPSEEARRLFSEYVACKWRIRVFAIEPVVEQQNVADFLSRRAASRLDVAGITGPGAGAAGAAGSAGSQADVDAAAVRLNPTMVGFGAGESTFGWRFYPRVQVPPRDDLVRRAEKAFLGDVIDDGERQVEPGQRECTALVVMPNFVPAIEFTTIAGWFHHSALREIRPTELGDSIALCKKLERAKQELSEIKRSLPSDGSARGPHLRSSEILILEDRLQQLEDMLPTQHYVSALPYGSDPVDAEIFESRGGNLAPTLTAWHGQPPDGTTDASLMIEGRGFSVHDTRVIIGNTPAESVPISRTVLLVKVAANAPAMTAPDGRSYYDVHVATPNGVSNHLLIEVHRGGKIPPGPAGLWDACLGALRKAEPVKKADEPPRPPAPTLTPAPAPGR